MRQAIEEGFILDVLKNYTNYKVAYNLALKIQAADQEVESKKARVKLNQWVRLHDYNIAQKVKVIVEHFKDNVMGSARRPGQGHGGDQLAQGGGALQAVLRQVHRRKRLSSTSMPWSPSPAK